VTTGQAGGAGPLRTRLARPDELARLQRIEVAAGRLFATIGMDDVAGDDPLPVARLAVYQADGRAWVSVDGDDRAVGYALACEVDGLGHLEQLSVLPAAGRQGRGAALLDAVAGWARSRLLPALTLSTFLDVPWNAPYYERHGFRVLAEHELTSGLRRLREVEAAHGLDTSRRAFMRREL
jgi:GNAT superfamily N-acetyltransferase